MSAKISHSLVAIVVLAAAAAGPVRAEPTQVFPLAAPDLPEDRRGTAERLTQAIADAMGAELSSVSIEDAAGLLECDVEATRCLESVSRSLDGKQLVFGTIREGRDGTLTVTLTRFRLGPDRQQRAYQLTGETEALPDELVRKAARLLGTPASDEVAASRIERALAPDTPRDTAPARRGGRVTAGTWALLGGGVALAGAGLGFRLSARGLRDEVEAAPRDTVEDFAHLVALEDQGRLHTRLGAALLIGGGVALGAGVVRAVLQHRRDPIEAEERAVGVVPVRGGAAVTVTWGLR